MVNDREAFLILVKISLVDNDLDPAEEQLLFDYGTDTFDISINQIKEICKNEIQLRDKNEKLFLLQLEKLIQKVERRFRKNELFDIAKEIIEADGKYTLEEKNTLEFIRKLFFEKKAM